MKKTSDTTSETSSLSAIEHLLQHRPDCVRSLRLAARDSVRLQNIEALARARGIKPSREKGLPENDSAIASLAPFKFAELKPLVERLSSQPRCVLVALDHVQDPQNMGALSRTAEGLGVAGMVIPKARSVSVTGSVYASSAGAVATLPICQVANLNEALRQLKEAGFWIVGTSLGEGTTTLSKMPDFEKVVLVLGAEGEGLSHLTESLCDWRIQIPLRGLVQSLNVSAAGAILMYELMKRST